MILTKTAWAGFGNVSYNLTDKLSVEAGVRWSYEEHTGWRDMEFHPIPWGAPHIIYTGDEDWDHVSPKFGISYQISEESLLYGSISNGWKSGVIALTNPPGRERVEEEDLWAYEVGAKRDWFDKRLRTNVAAFYYDYTDVHGYSRTLLGVALSNANDAKIYGAEVEVTARPVSALTLNGSVSYLSTSYEDFITFDYDNNLVDVSGNIMPHAPEWKIVAGAQYVFQIGDFGFLTPRGDLTWTDDVFHDQFNEGLRQQEAFALINASLGFETSEGNWKFELYAKNLTDKEYYFTTFSASENVTGYVGIPQLFGFQVIYKY